MPLLHSKLQLLQQIPRPLADPVGALGARSPFAPKIFSKIIQFSGNWGKTHILSKSWAQGPPPLTKILDLALQTL